MRILLVGDEPLALRRLVRMVEPLPGVEIVGVATDGGMALELAGRLRPDLVILDVEMPGPDGLAVAAGLAGSFAPRIVILSAFDRYAVHAFSLDAVDYLLKPVRPDRLRVAIARAERRRAEITPPMAADGVAAVDGGGLRVPDGPGQRTIRFVDIIWIEAVRDYVLVHTASRSHLLRGTMSDIGARLPASMPRVHRSAFVNLAYVQHWSRNEAGHNRLVLTDGLLVPVGPSYLKAVRGSLRHWLT